MDASQRYRLVRLIKRGGMAELFEALVEGPGGFQRRVAIKRMLAERAGEEGMIESFVDEANITSRLHHANIVNVFDFGVMDGLPFQAMELVDGLDLANLAEKRIPIEAALHVAAEVAHALEYAHRARGANGEPLGIVHRDVSPENILISWAADVKLADFGIARAFERRAPTTVNVARGKLQYMAPEQLRGEIADARADIFALGCVLHELLAGSSPTADENMRRTVIAGGRATVEPAIPEDVRAIIGRAIDPVKASRHPNAAVFAAECVRALVARTSSDGRSVLRGFLETIEDPPQEAKKARHPLEALMDVEIVLEDPSRELRRFVSVAASISRSAITENQKPEDDSRETTAPGVMGPAMISPRVGRATPKALKATLLGQTAGSFELLEVIGTGGFATVYRARHLVLGVERAIKVLRTGAPLDHEVRFHREIATLEALDHPNVVRIEEAGLLDDERAFLVMELIRGRTLRELVDEGGRFTDERAGTIARQLALGLDAAHRLGFVHRDLKPTNVLLTGEPGGEVVKILDFGVALLLDEQERQTRLTRAGRTVGTPRWMAPEQIRAAPDIGPRADLYALGALMYLMVAGRPPFDGDAGDVMDAHLYDRPAPLPRKSAFEALIDKLLEKHPENRPESALAVVAWIDRAMTVAGNEGANETTDVRTPAPERPTYPPSPTAIADTAIVPRSATAKREPDTVLVAPSTSVDEVSVKIDPPAAGRARLALVATLLMLAALLALGAAVFARRRPPIEVPGTEPVVIAKPGAVARAETAARSEQVDPRERERRAPPPVRTPAPAPAKKPAAKSFDELEASLDKMLAARGLSRAELAEHDETRSAAADVERARERDDEEAAKRAYASLMLAIRALPMDASFVQRRLDRARSRLSGAVNTITPEELAAFEKRYLDLRTKVLPSMSRAESAALVEAIDAFERDLARAPN